MLWFLQHSRAVELTSAGAQLLRAVVQSLERIDRAIRIIVRGAGPNSFAICTWTSFASMCFIPRPEIFQRENPDMDIRIDTTDASVAVETTGVDLALRYRTAAYVPAHAQRLLNEQLTPVISRGFSRPGH